MNLSMLPFEFPWAQDIIVEYSVLLATPTCETSSRSEKLEKLITKTVR